MRALLAALLMCGACSSTEPVPAASPPAHMDAAPEGHGPGSHGPEAHAHAAPAMDHSSHDMGHMERMEAQRSRLKTELGDRYDRPVAGLDGANLEIGRTIFTANCAACHGPAGKGDGPAGAALTLPPANFTDAYHASFYSDAARVSIIRNGIPDTAMVGFGATLTDAETLDLYAYIRSLRPAPTPH